MTFNGIICIHILTYYPISILPSSSLLGTGQLNSTLLAAFYLISNNVLVSEGFFLSCLQQIIVKKIKYIKSFYITEKDCIC